MGKRMDYKLPPCAAGNEKSPNSKEWTNLETARLAKHWKPQRRPLKSVENRVAGTKEE